MSLLRLQHVCRLDDQKRSTRKIRKNLILMGSARPGDLGVLFPKRLISLGTNTSKDFQSLITSLLRQSPETQRLHHGISSYGVRVESAWLLYTARRTVGRYCRSTLQNTQKCTFLCFFKPSCHPDGLRLMQ